jgi:FkbM family methyltransferase
MTMPGVRQIVTIVTDLSCQVIGRRSVVRAARFVLSRARLDYPNDLTANGESALQRWILALPHDEGPIHVADVGANIGRWSESMLATAIREGREKNLCLHAFEPQSAAFDLLVKTVHHTLAHLNKVVLSDREGTAVLHVVAPAAGTNSLHPLPDSAETAEEIVPSETLDSYATRLGLRRIALVKIDVEGHDLAVLRGARTLLAEHRITVVQFEYNHRWVLARCFLKDAFELLIGLGYEVGKLTPRGVEFYPGWDPDLETFIEGNYIACVPSVAKLLPAVAWWKSDSLGNSG